MRHNNLWQSGNTFFDDEADRRAVQIPAARRIPVRL